MTGFPGLAGHEKLGQLPMNSQATCVVWLKPNVSTVNICLLPDPHGLGSWGCSVSGSSSTLLEGPLSRARGAAGTAGTNPPQPEPTAAPTLHTWLSGDPVPPKSCKVCNYAGNFNLSLQAVCLDLSRQGQDWNICKNLWIMGAPRSHTHRAVHQHSSYRLTTKPSIPPLQPHSWSMWASCPGWITHRKCSPFPWRLTHQNKVATSCTYSHMMTAASQKHVPAPKSCMATRHLSCLFLMVICYQLFWTRVCRSCQLQSSPSKGNTLPAAARFWWVLCRRKGRRKKLRGCRLENLRFSTQLQLSNPSSTVKSQTTRWELKTYTGLQGLIEEWFQLLTVL